MSPSVSFAPMEGITTRVLRSVHYRLYPSDIDRYYTPFIYVHAGRAFKKRDLRDLTDPVNDAMKELIIPQIMASHADEIIWAVRELSARGFREINLNLGCPSATVVKKGHGAALLAEPDALERLLDSIFGDAAFEDAGVRLSVKTRLGMQDPEEFKRILPVLDRSGVSGIILHPRTQQEKYAGRPHRDYVRWALENTGKPVCYNGDLFAPQDAEALLEELPGLSGLMLGRGLLSDPALAGRIKGKREGEDALFWEWIAALETEYDRFLDERQLLFKLKDLWNFACLRFAGDPDAESCIHRIRIAKNLADYRNALYRLKAGR